MKSLLRVLALSMIFSTAYVSREAEAVEMCRGTCTVHCASGATYYYYVRPSQCCSKISNCPVSEDLESWAEWFPDSSWECSGDPWNAFLC
jgi:hypothetical protein